MYLKKTNLHVLTGLHWVEEQGDEVVKLLACGTIGRSAIPDLAVTISEIPASQSRYCRNIAKAA